MTDTYDNYDSFDPRYLEEQQRRQAASSLIGAADDDPEKAARAVELGGATGVDSSLIHSDLEGFEQQQKIAVNNKLIGDNLFLQNYLNSHPMAAAISHDDLGQLDAASQAISAIPSKSFAQQAQDFLKFDRVSRGALHGWGDAPLGYALLPDKPFAKTGNPILDTWYQFAEATARAEVTLPEIALRGINAAIFGTAYGLLGEEQGEKLGQMITDPGLQMTLQGQGPHGALIASFQAALRSVSPWLRARKDVPVNVSPEVNKLKIEQAKVDGDALSDALKESTKSATRERSADYFATFAKGHPEANREIGISADAIQELYGEKVPTPEDNLLGWVPGINEKLSAAAATGGDVRVPLSDWLAKVDPEVAKTLHDHLRIRDGGLTIDEGRLLEPKESVPEPLSALRATGGLEPLFSNGDRKIKIERTKDSQQTPEQLAKGQGLDWETLSAEDRGYWKAQSESIAEQHTKFGTAQGFHDFDLLDETGKPVGSVSLSEQKGGKQLYIEMIQAGADKRMYDPNFLGPALIRDIKRQLKAEFPNAESITGHRVSGAREKAGTYNDPSATPVVKLSQRTTFPGWGEVDTTAVDLRSLFEGVGQQTIPTSGSLLHYDPSLAPHKAAMDVAIREELARIAGPQAKVFTPDSISVPGRPDIARGGFFQQFREQDPWIVVALDSKDPLGATRHEAVHHLRQQGFFDSTEWSTLTRTARDQGWLEKHDIATRYPDLPMSSKLEEAIAEGYRTWKSASDKEHIVSAAIKVDNQIFTGTIHSDAFEAASKALGRTVENHGEGGFVTSSGRYVGRKEALKIAEAASQVAKERLPKGEAGEELLAEALRTPEGLKLPKDVHVIFEKLKAFFEALRTRLKEITGRDLSWEEIFKKVDEGEVAAREGNVPIREGAFRQLASDELHPDIGGATAEKLRERITSLSSELNVAKGQGFDIHAPEFADRTTALREAQSSLRDLTSGAFGLTVKDFENYQRLMAKRHVEDLEASTKRALAQQKQMQTKEWKADRTDMRDTVREELEGRPDLAVDAMMSAEKLKFHPDFLTDEQKAALPKEFIQKKNGINPDDAAGFFGYHSGDAMIDRLAMITADRKAVGMSSREWLNHLIDTETDRRMQEKYGNLDERILEEAKDQALSENQLNIVHQEMLFLGMLAKEPFPLTKQRLRQELKTLFDKTPIGTISTDAFLRDSGKAERAIQSALLEGDVQGAFREGQRRNNAQIMASYAKAYEKARKSFDRTAKTFSKREVSSVPAEWTNWIHDILLRTGNRVNRSIQDLAENIDRHSEKTLTDFVEAKEAESMGQRETPVADFLLDPTFRTEMDNLTAEQFTQLKQSIDVLIKQGRDERKIYAAGEAHDLGTTLIEMRGKLQTFPKQLLPDERGWLAEKMQDPRKFIAGLTAIPTLLHRWDRADPRGIFNRYLNYPLRRAANTENVLQREVSKALEGVGPVQNGNKLVDAPFADPLTRSESDPNGRAWPGFTRNHVMGMLANAGNRSNWKVLARGFSADPQALWDWLGRNITKEDIEQAQKRGNDIFHNLVKKADLEYEHATGATVEKLALEPITFILKDGTQVTTEGWYHPLVADPLRREVWVKDPDTGSWSRNATGPREKLMDKYGGSYATTANGYTRGRTGATYPLDLDISTMNRTINQMIHDISYRTTLLEAQKIFSNRSFQAEVIKHYGAEYAGLLDSYLQEMAGRASVPDSTQKWVGEWSEYLRQNVISTYIGFNPYTAMKHGPTALVMSSAEVGAGHFLPQFGKQLLERLAGDPLRKALEIVGADNYANAVKSLYARSPELGLTMSEFAMKHSESLQRRERHWQDTIAGETKVLEGASTLREKVIEKGSWLVAQSDMLSAKPTWIAEYNKQIAEGSSHGEAIDLADSAVDRAHGSTARTNQPALVRGGGPAHSWLTSVYGFMGTRMQRMIELGHQLNDIHHLGKEGELTEAAKRIPKLLTNAMAFAIWPIIVEEAVQAINNEDHHTYGTRIASALTLGMSSSVLYLRDIIHGLASDHEPGVGLLSSAAHDLKRGVVDVFRGKEALNKQHAGRMVGDILTILGETRGVAPKTIDNAARFGIDLVNKQQHPKTFMDYFRGITRGDIKKRVER